VPLGSSLFLIAVGAILKFAVTATVADIDLQVVGVILMVIGAIGLVISLFLIFNASNRQPPAPPAPPTQPQRRPPAGY
jgi:hypothetical protein